MLKSLDKIQLPNPNLSGLYSQQDASRLKELDRRVSEQSQALDKLQGKLHATEKLAYDFRRDLTKGLNEVEVHTGKRCEQLARAVQEVNRMLLVSGGASSTPSIPPMYLTSNQSNINTGGGAGDRRDTGMSQKQHPGSAPYPFLQRTASASSSSHLK
jgi:uncharacterized coiled-coil protein SlyX